MIGFVDDFPDPSRVTFLELRAFALRLTAEDLDLSGRRRIVLGKIDILRAELLRRQCLRDEPGDSGSSPTREPRRPGPKSGAGAILLPIPPAVEDDEPGSAPRIVDG